jgi:hypothetical protein
LRRKCEVDFNAFEIRLRFSGVSEKEIEKELLNEDWPIGAIREALEKPPGTGSELR